MTGDRTAKLDQELPGFFAERRANRQELMAETVSSPPATVGEDPPAISLDGKSFTGRGRFTGLFWWVSREITIEFKAGTFT